jgi:hypothetical protein
VKYCEPKPCKPVHCDPVQLDLEFWIEAVVTCVGCADILAYTLPHNYHMFDDYVVVTAPEDKATRKVCDYYGVKCVLTDKFRTRWEEFCKGSGINEGLRKLSKRGWVAHMDADIILPPHFRKQLKAALLDQQMIYGIDRAEFKSYEDHQRFIGKPEPQRAGPFIHTTHTLPHANLGTRVAFEKFSGYVPIGFFQLWHPGVSGVSLYPEGHTTAAREDTLFPALWPRAKRGFIPEIIAHHLESQQAEMGVNWQGRKTKPFGIAS